MNNKKTAAIFSLVPRDLGSIQVVRCTSTRRTFVKTLVRTESLQQQDAASYLSSTGSSMTIFRQVLGAGAGSSLAGGDSAVIGAQHCQATPRTLFPPWWGYRAGTCEAPNPTKFFARSAERGSLRHPPPPRWLVGVCTP